ncbi:MAG: TIGR04086 family membrane protein [Eubacterium ramulus]
MERAEGNNNKDRTESIGVHLLVMYTLLAGGGAVFLLAFLLYKMELTENIVTIGIMVIYVVSGLLGGIIIGKRMKTRRFCGGF